MSEPSGTSRHGFSAIAGHPALDLVNTVSWRLSAARSTDALGDFADIVAFAEQFGLVDPAVAAELRALAGEEPALAARERDRVRSLREALYAAGYGSDGEGLVATEYAEAVAAGRLQREGSGPAGDTPPWTWRLDTDLALPRHRLALAAVDLLTSSVPDDFGQCADEECGWVFLDTSPRRNRRWCVSADCGNRNRVRRHNERVRRRS